jgi:hypothetical protein
MRGHSGFPARRSIVSLNGPIHIAAVLEPAILIDF